MNLSEHPILQEVEECGWRYMPIKHYEDYIIIETGHVYSIKTKKILEFRVKDDGYVRVQLCKGNKWINGERQKSYAKQFFVHRLTCMHFNGKPDNYKELHVNHIDGNTMNCAAWNTEWMTPPENQLHKYASNGFIGTIKHELTDKIVAAFSAGMKCVDIAKEFNMVKSSVHYHLQKAGLKSGNRI